CSGRMARSPWSWVLLPTPLRRRLLRARLGLLRGGPHVLGRVHDAIGVRLVLVGETCEAGGNTRADAHEALAQRVTGESVPQEDPAQVRVALELDAHQVVDLALLEQGTLVNRVRAWEGGPVMVEDDRLHDDLVVQVQRLQVVDHLEVMMAVD